jgi:hypothetical protein
LVLVAAGVLCAALWSCSDESKTGAPVETSTVRLEGVEALPALLTPGDTTVVRVRVLDRITGLPLSGIQVTFGEIAGKMGDFLKTSALTDSTGWASSSYIPTLREGQVGLRVEAEGEVAYVTLRVAVVVDDPNAMKVALTAAETTLPADGASTLGLQVLVTRGGIPVAGQTVRFTAGELFQDLDKNGVWSGPDLLVVDQNRNGVWDAIGSVTDSLLTAGDGTALATYTAGESVGSVYIKASLADAATDLEIYLHPTGTVLALSVFPSELPADGFSEAVVSAVVTDPTGAPVPGKLVRFTAGEPFTDADGDGYFTPGLDSFEDWNANGAWDALGQVQSSVTTTSSGRADAVLTAGRTVGAVRISASTRDSKGVATLSLLSLPHVARAELEAPILPLYANGLDEGSFRLTLWDAHGQPIPGKSVTLVAGERFDDKDGDGRFTAGVDDLLEEVVPNGTWDALGSIEGTAPAGFDGEVLFDYRAPDVAGTVWIHASAGPWKESFPVEIAPLPSVAELFHWVDYDDLHLRNSGGRERTPIHVTGYDVSGSTVPAGIPITFRILGGPGVLEKDAGSEVLVMDVMTDAGGTAETVVRSGETPGTIRVEIASSGAVREVQIGVSVGPPSRLAVTAGRTDMPSWETTMVTAYVTDSYQNPVVDGTVVGFSVDEGMIVADDGTATARTFDGRAFAFYYSLAPQPGGDGLAVIVASANNGAVSDSVFVGVPQADLIIHSLEISASATEVGVQGAGDEEQATVMVRAFGLDGDAVGQGLPVTFTIVSGPDGGESLDGESQQGIEVLTDATGMARVHLRSGTKAGTVKVRASADGGVAKEIVLGIAAGPPTGIDCPIRMDVRCSDNGLPSQREFTIFVHDLHRNAVREGTVVHLETDKGLVVGDAGLGSSATRDGLATATFTAPWCNDGSPAVITCESYGGEILCEFDVLLVECSPCVRGSVARVDLEITPDEIRVRGTGGTEQAWMTATGLDSLNHPVAAGHEITFEIIQGPGGGENLGGQGYGPVTVETDANGEASVVLGSGIVSGTVLLRASSAAGVSEMALVAIASGPPVHLSIGVNPCNIRGWDVVGEIAEIVVIVSDVYNNPVPDGTRVYFTADEGIVRGAISGELGSGQTLDGVCDATYLSGSPRENGIVTVSGSTAGGTVVGDVSFLSSGPPSTVTFVSPVPPVGVAADGESEIEIMVEVLDVNDNYVVGGTEVEFKTDVGTVGGSGTTADGCYGSLASDVFKSEVLQGDFSYSIPDNGIGAVANVTVQAGLGGAVADALQIQLFTASASRNTSQMDIDGEVAVSGVAAMTVTIKDRYGNPLGGHVLDVDVIGGGSFAPPSITTDMWGEASGLFHAPSDTSTVTIQVTDTDPGYGGLVMTKSVNVQ